MYLGSHLSKLVGILSGGLAAVWKHIMRKEARYLKNEFLFVIVEYVYNNQVSCL